MKFTKAQLELATAVDEMKDAIQMLNYADADRLIDEAIYRLKAIETKIDRLTRENVYTV